MKQSLIFLVFLSTASCRKVYQGKDAPEKAAPFYAALYNNDRLEVTCGGSIIAHKAVLTAAHCVADVTDDGVPKFVLVGTTNLLSGGVSYEIAETICNKNYTGYPEYQNDIAIVITRLPMEFNRRVSPISLIDYQVSSGNGPVRFFGLGLLGLDISPFKLQMVDDLYVVGLKKCKKQYAKRFPDAPALVGTQTCIRSNTSGICPGDSGGPYVYKGKLIGVESYGDDCTISKIPEVVTNVYRFRQWIRGVIKRTGANLSPWSKHPGTTVLLQNN